MALSQAELRQIITREENKLVRQTDAVETTRGAIEIFTEQLELFLVPAEFAAKKTPK